MRGSVFTTDLVSHNYLYLFSLVYDNTVEPPNKGHVGTRHFVLLREVFPLLKSELTFGT